jgi:hypothetical protein
MRRYLREWYKIGYTLTESSPRRSHIRRRKKSRAIEKPSRTLNATAAQKGNRLPSQKASYLPRSVSMGGARSVRNHPEKQAPDIKCRSTVDRLHLHFWGVRISGLPGKEGAAGSHNDCIVLKYRTDSTISRIQFY